MTDRFQLSQELIDWRIKIESHAREAGLDFYPVIFEVVDWREMNMMAAYGGFPNRYPHWSFGMQYERLSKTDEYGLSKIYEMVINNDPCYAYLLHSNHLVDQKLVMAHVFGHCDFFKNNLYFAHTHRKMMDVMANHKVRIQRLVDRHGVEKIEKFIDVCLSVENLIDSNSPFFRRQETTPEVLEEDSPKVVQKLKSKEYMDRFINPPDFMEREKRQILTEEERKIPSSPEKDILFFILQYGQLEKWEREILSIIREEAYYFVPQRQTKIMNEGWASYWHSTLMTGKILNDSEIIDYADHHSGTVSTHPGRLNPYKLGLELFRNIEERWNKGKFGKEYEECDDLVEKKRWNKNLGIGKNKIFEVRKLYNDLTFIDTFLTPEFCEEQKLFVYDYHPNSNSYRISNRDFKKIKEKLLFSLTNGGDPILSVTEGNYQNRGELYLLHHHEGIDLKIDWLKLVLRSLQSLWGRPVWIETIVEGIPFLYSFNGQVEKEIKKQIETETAHKPESTN